MINVPIQQAATVAAAAADQVTMTQGEKIELMWFQPWQIIMYLVILFSLMVVYYQWKWSKTCREKILLLLVRSDSTTYSVLVPKSEGEVTLKDRVTNRTKSWPMSKMGTIDVLYPGVGFVPAFLQKYIKMTILDENDWEPMINRDPEKHVIGSPSVLGNLLHERITELVMTISRDTMDRLAGLIGKVEKMVDRQTFYLGIGLVAIVCIVLTVFVVRIQSGQTDIRNEIDRIERSMGIPTADELSAGNVSEEAQ